MTWGENYNIFNTIQSEMKYNINKDIIQTILYCSILVCFEKDNCIEGEKCLILKYCLAFKYIFFLCQIW